MIKYNTHTSTLPPQTNYKFTINGSQRLCSPLLRRGKVVLRKIKTMLSVLVFRPKPVTYPVSEGWSCGPFIQMSLQNLQPSQAATTPSEPKPSHYRGFTIAPRYTTFGRAPLEEQHSQQTSIHALGGSQTSNPIKRAAANPRLKPRFH
jgi:hypothetical protein